MEAALSRSTRSRGVAGDGHRAWVSAAAGHEFLGFPDLRANVTFVPLQFFTGVLPHRSRKCVRLVGYMLRQLLGWVDEQGNPKQERVSFSYRDLTEGAGISRDSIAAAIDEAVTHRLIQCLRSPRPDQAGQSAQSGVYALRWSDHYTNSPDEFHGFFQREAVVMPNATTAPVAKAARKNIPNAYFDHVLRQEPLSVARVVGTLLFRSIEWGPGGERKQPVCLSITELSRLTRLSRRHVHEAIKDALSHGYVEIVKAGRFDGSGGGESEAATYRIRWSAATSRHPVAPASRGPAPLPPCTISDRSETEYGQPVGNGARDQSEMVHGNRSEMGNGISIKKSFNRSTTAAAVAGTPFNPNAAAARGVVETLVEVGFDPPTADYLARHHSFEVILRQIEWLPLRRASTSKLGLLRRAIERDWPKPETSADIEAIQSEHVLGAAFARHYEAAFHQRAELPVTCSAKEAARAEEFVHLLKADATEVESAEWGRQFGAFARGKTPPKPWVVWVLRVYGDEFVRRHRQIAQRLHEKPITQPLRLDEEAEASADLERLRALESSCKQEQPNLYARFAAEHEKAASRFKLSAKSRALLASDGVRLPAFGAFARSNGLCGLEPDAVPRAANFTKFGSKESERRS